MTWRTANTRVSRANAISDLRFKRNLNINLAHLVNFIQVVEWGKKYGLHISLNFHRGPGYCVNRGETEHDHFATVKVETAAGEALSHLASAIVAGNA